MHVFRSVSLAASAVAMVLTPVAASAAPAAQALSIANVAPQRASVVSEDESQANGTFIAIGVAVMFIVGLVVLLGNDDDESASA